MRILTKNDKVKLIPEGALDLGFNQQRILCVPLKLGTIQSAARFS